MGRKRMLEQVYEQIAGQQQRRRAQHRMVNLCRRLSAQPQAHDLRHNLNKDSRQHEARAQRYQIAQHLRILRYPVLAGQQQTTKDIRQCYQRTEQEQAAKTIHVGSVE